MRTLLTNEMNAVSGAGYSEDIVTAAASIYVGSNIGGFAAAFTKAGFTGASTAFAGTGIAAPLAMMGQIMAPAIFFLAPALAFDAVYPGVLAEKFAAYC